MSIRSPLNVGTVPGVTYPPEAVIELLAELKFDSEKLSPDEMRRRAHLIASLWFEYPTEERLAAEGVDLEGVEIGGDVCVVRGRGVETPLFPLRIAGKEFPSAMDIEEAIERIVLDTTTWEYARDHAGRAYDVCVRVSFERRPELDSAPDREEVVSRTTP